ncbi:Lymphocyte cytosolic protein 2 [Habropoda laboriosa]|uniref:Lymphocyte cytosolic protein 2 n=1 Tax=Habropoda laboriosa TaxID=597456 RepID=A0A0L7RJI3_9HYME|nr:Lymphocyte cytosolic protein 2 [Habropoda laboriosa]
MFKKLSRSDALEDISNWSINDVLCLLRKNGLEECCKTITKRQIDGDELLHLTEGKLALWKSDLTRPLIWNLWTFVEEVRRSPEKFVEEKILESQTIEDHLSDTDSWGTDFEDEVNEESSLPETQKPGQLNFDSKSNHQASENNVEFKQRVARAEEVSRQHEEGTYANSGLMQNDENTYANCQESKSVPLKNTSKLYGQSEKSLTEQLKEQLKFRNTKKPMAGPKPEFLQARTVEMTASNCALPRKSFLYNALQAKPQAPSQIQKRMMVPPPPEPKRNKDPPVIIKKSNKDQTKPSATLRSLDLVANLPTRTEESEDEYEAFDEQIIEQNQKKNIWRVDSKQSLISGHQSSAESVYQPPSVTSYEEEDEPYEIYESITETPHDSGYYLNPIQRMSHIEAPPPLPAKPSQRFSTPSPTPSRMSLDKSKGWKPCDGMSSCFYLRLSKQLMGGLVTRLVDEVCDIIVRMKRGLVRCFYIRPPDPPVRLAKMTTIIGDSKRNVSLNTATRRQASLSECLTQAALTQARLNLAKRSPEKKSATLPHSLSNTSLSSERATRPLPPPPERQSYIDKSWFHNVTRQQSTNLIKEQSTYGNPQDGYFLLRPSSTNVNNPLVLVLWYKDRVCNVPVRKRPDNRYALGSAKANEQSFTNVEEIVMFHKREELVLHSGGVKIGSTKLTDSPPK